jgi:hypothetical protein
MLPVLVMRTIFSTLDTSPWPFTPGCALPSPPRPTALQIPRDRCNSEGASPAFIKHRTISGAEIAIDFDRLPTLGVPDIIHGNVIVLAPIRMARQRTMARGAAFAFSIPCRRKSLAVPKPASTRQIRWPKQHDASLTLTSPVNPILKYNRRLPRSGAVSFYAVSPRKGRHRSSACISC